MTEDDNRDKADAETSETRELTVSRIIGGPPARVYEAFVDPEELAQWMHPPGFAAEVHDFEAVEGGSYRISMSGTTEGTAEYRHTYNGTFEKVVPGERIVQTEMPEPDGPGMDSEMTVTSPFEEVPDRTGVTVRIEIPAEWPDEAIGGWEAALGNLAALLEGA